MSSSIQPINPTPDLAAARSAWDKFTGAQKQSATLVCMHDCDADGIAAGVVWQRALERMSYANVIRVIPDRDRNAWTPNNRAQVEKLNADAVYLLDLGSTDKPVDSRVPNCFIDHHFPEGIPTGGALITAYPWNPIPNTSLLMYDLCRESVDLDDMEWVAAVGTFSDLGEKAPFDIIASSKKRYTAKYLKEATALVNAARRAAEYAPEIAARAMLEHESPRALVEADDDDARWLRDARAEIKSAMEEAKKAAPKFAGNVALIRINSRCQIHPLIAQIWRGRLPKFVVIAANEGYRPGRINFSARSGPQSTVGALALLKSSDIAEGEGNFGHGHDMASGGSLPVESWNELLASFGFDSSVFAAD